MTWRVAGTYLESCNCDAICPCRRITGLAGGQVEHFPWAWKASNLFDVKPAQIEIDHTPRKQWFRVKDVVSVRISGPYPGDETVTCVIPGHDRSGEEVIAEEVTVNDGPLRFEYRGKCGYAADFDYRST